MTGIRIEELIGVPASLDDIEREVAAVISKLQAFGIPEKIIGSGLNTTVVNGIIQGVCVNSEQDLDNPM